jgi:phage I-like protein
VRFLTGLHVTLEEGKRTSTVTLTRTGRFYDPRYGEFEISRDLLLQMVDNFQRGTYGQEIFIDVAHRPGDGAAGKILSLSVEGERLRARVEWTDYGLEAIKRRGYRYLSAEFHENYQDNEERRAHGAVLFGAGLTIRPVIKRLDPVQLAVEAPDGVRVLMHPELTRELSAEATHTMTQYIKMLLTRLQALKLSQPAIDQLLKTYEQSAKALGEDNTQALEALVAEFEGVGKQLAEASAQGPAAGEISVQLSQAAGVSRDDVLKILAEAESTKAAAAKQLAESREANLATFRGLIEKAEGLADETRKRLSEAEDLITAEMSPEQVTRLAEHQIQLGGEMEAARQLAAMGYQPAGSPRIQVGASNEVMSLQEEILKNLRGTTRHAMGALRLSEKPQPFVERVLAEFDRVHATRLHAEHKMLAGGTTGVSDTALPSAFQRTVIREALSDLNVLALVQALTDPSAQITTGIPYEQRDTTDVANDGVVYETGAIHRASVAQAMDYAYILPMKLGFLISNEVMHFSRSSSINWDAYARNVESNARVLRELITRRVCNELQRSADAYGAAAVTNEDLAAQLTGSASIVRTAEFPIVRPHQQYDIQGNTVGSVEHPLTVRLNGAEIEAYDGSGTQSVGTYYRVVSYNLGQIQFVNQLGAPVTPSSSVGADDISYHYATNVAKFDLDLPANTALEVHLNGLLRAVGARKAVMSADRYVEPDFLLMSPVLNDTATNAEAFAASQKRDGSDTDAMGDLTALKGVSAWKTNAPAVDLGDERILMGQRGTLSYVLAKPFTTGEPFEAVNAAGKPTGQKQAYGEEYSAIKVPSPIRGRLTSVIAYSASGR